MWVLFVTLCVIIPPVALKESESIESIPEGDRKLLIELVKRLQNDKNGWNSAPRQASTAKCEVSPKQNFIIKRKDSEKYGAKNLGYFEDVASNDACSELCCQNSECDLAVYENKDRHYCYLFRCEGKCVFSHHSSYISTDVVHHLQPTSTADNSESEQDLQGSNGEGEEEEAEDGDEESESSAPSLTTTVEPPTQATQLIRAHSVGLEGYCKIDIHCEDPNGECNDNKCVCQAGFYRKGHICRKVCQPSAFACLELGTIGRGPHCVAGSEVCDVTTQCADGSDEFNCPATESSVNSQEKNGANKPTKTELGSSSKEQSAPHDSSPSQDTGSQESVKHEEVPAKDTDKNENGGGNTEDVDGSKPDHPQSVDKTPGDSDVSDSIEKDDKDTHQSPGKGSSGSLEFADGDKDKDSTKGQSSSDDDSFFSKAKLDFSSETISMQGPIIALSLGLAFTVILLIFVACRLRIVRRRLRKGRPLHSNEADYLINGMYL